MKTFIIANIRGNGAVHPVNVKAAQSNDIQATRQEVMRIAVAGFWINTIFFPPHSIMTLELMEEEEAQRRRLA